MRRMKEEPYGESITNAEKMLMFGEPDLENYEGMNHEGLTGSFPSCDFLSIMVTIFGTDPLNPVPGNFDLLLSP
jgi:hypothetical protein